MRPSAITIFSSLVGISVASAASVGDVFFSSGNVEDGFTVPESLPPGVYSVSFDSSGHALHTLLGNVTVVPTNMTSDNTIPVASPGGSLTRRDGRFGCSTRGRLNADWLNALAQQLMEYCGNGHMFPVGTHISVSSAPPGGTTHVVFFCLHAHNPPQRNCYASEINHWFGQIMSTCGSYMPGWWDWWSGNTIEYTYGYDLTGDNLNFCGRNH